MTTEKATIDAWFEKGIASGNRWMIVVCDTFDWGDYPVFVGEKANFWKTFEKYDGKNMQKIMEVYDLSLDKYDQLDQRRVWNVPGNNS
jgi:hypothetical protein